MPLRKVVVALVAVTLLPWGATSVASTERAAAPITGGSLRVTPAQPVVGERTVLTGRVPGRVRRPVLLQQARPGGPWRTVARLKRTGPFRFALFPTATVSVRIVAPRVPRRRTRAAVPRWTSVVRVIRPVPRRGSFHVPTEARAGEPVDASTVVGPVRRGTTTVLETAAGSGWRQVATGTPDAAGRVTLRFAAPAAGRHRLRLVTRVPGLPSLTLATTELRTIPAPTGVPRLDIVTEDGDPITSKVTYERATFNLAGGGLPDQVLSGRIRVRGNFTSLATVKLPFKVKLDQSTSVSGMPASKDWVLLANFFDRSLLRTTLGMEASRRVGLPWSPRMVDVEVWENGTFKGLYQVGEGVEIAADRVAPARGRVLEADSYADDTPSYTTDRKLQVFLKEPEDVPLAEQGALWSQLQDVEDVLYSPGFADPRTGYRSLIDVRSFVDWYLVMELTKNTDAGFLNSCWLTWPVGGRLAMGPIWDMDMIAGARRGWDLTDPTGWFVRHNWWTPDATRLPTQMTGPEGHWWVRLFEDPWFVEQVRARWREVRGPLMTLPAFVDRREALISAAADRNFRPVAEGGAGMPLGLTFLESPEHFQVHESWPAETAHLDWWLRARLTWMDQQLR